MKELKENWLPVKGYEGLYEVSDWGNVRSLNYHRTGEIRILRPAKDRFGYLYVGLMKDGKHKTKRIHRLVAEAFITNPNPKQYTDVNHKSECKMLNFACVLEHCTRKQNINYGTCNQRHADAVSKPVDQFDKDGNFIQRWKSATEASKQLGTNRGNICSCACGKCKTAGGYVWKFTS